MNITSDTRVEVGFTSESENSTTWEVSKFIKDLSDVYYRIDLLNTIDDLLCNHGIDKSDIVIFESSIKAGIPTSKCFNLNDDSDLNSLHYLGLQIALDNNSKVNDFNRLNVLISDLSKKTRQKFQNKYLK